MGRANRVRVSEAEAPAQHGPAVSGQQDIATHASPDGAAHTSKHSRTLSMGVYDHAVPS